MDTAIDWESLVDALASLNGLELDEARRAEVIVHLERMTAMARPLMDFDEDRDLEPAPVFRP